jgi:hypothetical protein
MGVFVGFIREWFFRVLVLSPLLAVAGVRRPVASCAQFLTMVVCVRNARCEVVDYEWMGFVAMFAQNKAVQEEYGRGREVRFYRCFKFRPWL